jgi:hypothetical protein
VAAGCSNANASADCPIGALSARHTQALNFSAASLNVSLSDVLLPLNGPQSVRGRGVAVLDANGAVLACGAILPTQLCAAEEFIAVPLAPANPPQCARRTSCSRQTEFEARCSCALPPQPICDRACRLTPLPPAACAACSGNHHYRHPLPRHPRQREPGPCPEGLEQARVPAAREHLPGKPRGRIGLPGHRPHRLGCPRQPSPGPCTAPPPLVPHTNRATSPHPSGHAGQRYLGQLGCNRRRCEWVGCTTVCDPPLNLARGAGRPCGQRQYAAGFLHTASSLSMVAGCVSQGVLLSRLCLAALRVRTGWDFRWHSHGAHRVLSPSKPARLRGGGRHGRRPPPSPPVFPRIMLALLARGS